MMVSVADLRAAKQLSTATWDTLSPEDRRYAHSLLGSIYRYYADLATYTAFANGRIEALSAAAELENEVNRLRAAMREIAFEVSAVGCEGADDAICIETNRAKEDWCPYCRIGTIVRDAA